MPRVRRNSWRRGICVVRGPVLLVTRGDGLVDIRQAAQLCHVGESTIRAWVSRGHLSKAGADECGRSLFDPVDLAKAEHKTRKRARRVFYPTAA